jgi:hypothetical protein
MRHQNSVPSARSIWRSSSNGSPRDSTGAACARTAS